MDVLDISAPPTPQHTLELGSEQISEVNADDISYGQFFSEFLLSNRPCLLKKVSNDWMCQKYWIKDGKPDFDFLKTKYGDAEVPVSNCKTRYFNAQRKCSMKMKEFLDYWEGYIRNNYNEKSECFYMKDWHFANENPSDEAYRVPSFFASDWINEYLLKGSIPKKDDYRFVYMGPKGSWTPLHADVFSSFSWSVNICGMKKWLFMPPGEEVHFKDKFGNLAFDVNSEELNNISMFPNYSSSVNKVILVQEVGDAIFVPSGWHHQVWNLDDTISFNHNWVNGCNILNMWTALNDCLNSVCQEISDCREMEGWNDQCQLVLSSCFGMDHMDFFRFITYISHSRIDSLKKRDNLVVNGWVIGTNHKVFDLRRVKIILIEMLNAKIPCYESIVDDIKDLIYKIDAMSCDKTSFNSNIYTR